MNGMVHGMMATRPLGRWSELEWKLLGLWRSVLHRWVWIVDISRRKEKGKKRKARKGKNDEGKGGKPGDGKGQSNNVQSTSDLINSCFAESVATSSVLFSRTKLRAWFSCICWDWSCTRVCFDSHLWRARVQETYTPRRTKPTWCSGMANQEEGKRFPVLAGEVGAVQSALQRRPAPVPRAVGLQTGEASWKPLEKGTFWFMHGYSENVEIPLQSEYSAKWR